MHLLRGDEVGAAPADIGRFLAGEFPAAAVELRDAQRATTDVGDPGGDRVRARVEHWAVDHQFAGNTTEQPCHVELAAESERGDRGGGVGGIGRDAASAFAHALAAQSLLGRQVLVVVRAQQFDRVADQSLLTAGQVEHPQAVHRVVASPAAQEHDPGAIGADGDVARVAQRESLAACVLAGKRVAHRRRVCQTIEQPRSALERCDDVPMSARKSRRLPTAWMIAPVAAVRAVGHLALLPVRLLAGDSFEDGSQARRRWMAWEWPLPRFRPAGRVASTQRWPLRFRVVADGAGRANVFVGSRCVAMDVAAATHRSGPWTVVCVTGGGLPTEGLTLVGSTRRADWWFATSAA